MWRKYKRIFYSYSQPQLLKMAAMGLLGLIVGGFLLTTVVFAIFSINLPDPNKVIRREGFSTIIYDRSGKTLYDLYNKENRIPLDLKDTPKYLQEATISIEDKDFYKHQGFSITGILRSIRNIVTFQGLAGGSTLTQQLVKNVLLSPERSLFRKIKEIILANQIEKKFTKDQILQMYLNEAPYGGATYGVESAAKNYFGKSAKDLNLVESAILAGLPQQPTNFSPFGASPKAYVNRTKQVLRRMREDGYISPQQELDAGKVLGDIQFASLSGSIKAPHFVFYVKEQLVKRFGEQTVEGGGLRVTTTLDGDLQEKSEQIVNEEIKKLKALKVGNGAAVILNPTSGEILTMVGSYDFKDKDYGSYNVTTALRQPGSAGKPFIYATAFAKNYTPATMLIDAKTGYPSGDPAKKEYIPENYDGKYRGPTQLRFALGNSINTVAVKLTALVGIKDILTNGYNAGISSWQPTDETMKRVGLSLALGGQEVKLLELTGAYGVFATGGIKNEPVSILKVTDSAGKVLYEYHPVAGRRVFSPEVSFLISHILSDNNARQPVFGENNLLQVAGRTVAVKTGTTDQKRDNWTVGYTPNLAVGVWVGNNDNTVMAPAVTSGVTGAAPIWNKIMRTALANTSNTEFKKPENVLAVGIDAMAGGLPRGSDPTRSEYFIKGTEPVAISSVYKKLKISKNNGKLANDIEIKSGQYDEKEFIFLAEDDPVSPEAGKNRWQEGINNWLNDNHKDDSLYHPPTDKSDANQNSVVINISGPSDHETAKNVFRVKAKAFAVRDIVKFTVSVDGDTKITKTSDSIDEDLTISKDGSHKLTFQAVDSAGNNSTADLTIGINSAWDAHF